MDLFFQSLRCTWFLSLNVSACDATLLGVRAPFTRILHWCFACTTIAVPRARDVSEAGWASLRFMTSNASWWHASTEVKGPACAVSISGQLLPTHEDRPPRMACPGPSPARGAQRSAGTRCWHRLQWPLHRNNTQFCRTMKKCLVKSRRQKMQQM